MSDLPTASGEPAFFAWVVSHKRISFGVAIFLAGMIAGGLLF